MYNYKMYIHFQKKKGSTFMLESTASFYLVVLFIQINTIRTSCPFIDEN